MTAVFRTSAADVLNKIDLQLERDVVVLRGVPALGVVAGQGSSRRIPGTPGSCVTGRRIRARWRRWTSAAADECPGHGLVCVPEPLQAGEPFGWHSDLGREQLDQPAVAEADFAGQRVDRWLAGEAEGVHAQRPLRVSVRRPHVSRASSARSTMARRRVISLCRADLGTEVGNRAVPHRVEIDGENADVVRPVILRGLHVHRRA